MNTATSKCEKISHKKKCEKISQNLKYWSECLRQVCAFRRNLTDSKVAPLGVNNLNLTTKLLLFTNLFFSPSIWYTAYFSDQQVVLNLISAKTTNWNPNFQKQTWILWQAKLEFIIMWLTLLGPLRWGTPAPLSGPRGHPAGRSSCQDLSRNTQKINRGNHYTRGSWIFMAKHLKTPNRRDPRSKFGF